MPYEFESEEWRNERFDKLKEEKLEKEIERLRAENKSLEKLLLETRQILATAQIHLRNHGICLISISGMAIKATFRPAVPSNVSYRIGYGKSEEKDNYNEVELKRWAKEHGYE